ncbi:MAG TPA: hypothetical protein VGL54_08530 [Solirubrobacteraceae bacterium]|jgi:hypothetical protein
MRHAARFVTLLGVLAGATMFATALAPVAQASFGPETFEAGTCINHTCTYASVKANPSEAVTQAASHPAWGITKFTMKASGSNPEEALRRIRVDVPSGLASNPEAPMPKCSVAQFDSEPKGCPPSSEVGTTEMEAELEVVTGIPVTLPTLTGTVYNLEAPPGLPLDFGINVEPAGELVTPVRLFLEGHVDWSGDYHEYFEINDVPREAGAKVLGLTVNRPLKVLMSKLNFNGHAGGNFLTIPSVCSSTTTSYLELESYGREIAQTVTHTPVGVTGCNKVPFAPTAEVTPGTNAPDQPDGATTIVKAKQYAGAEEINTADIQDAHVTLPEGLTLDPSAAHELGACTAAQIAIGTTNPVTCPASSRVGTVTIETDLPPGSLTGGIYLGSPGGGSITGPPYTIYLDAESSLGVSVRLQGLVTPNPSTGRLEATFTNNPPLPFSELRLSMNGGARAPLANPLVCGNAPTESLFSPYTTGKLQALEPTPFVTTGCPNPVPFALTQTARPANATAGAYSPYTFNLTRSDGQQYLSQISTTLPAGLLGAIPSVTLCNEPQAAAGTCSVASQIGVASATAGAGSEPYPLSGNVYLTGPYDGAPYGLSIPVAVVAGPFNLGTVTTRATIKVDPHTARVTVATTNLPTIVGGVPVRLKTLKVEVNRPSFIFNPTNCGALATESTLTSTFNATQSLSSAFQVGGCGSLAFKPTFKVTTSAKTSKKNGASLQVSLTQPAHEANMKSVFVSLPTQLPSRLTTLQKACPEATFAANPVNCRKLGSEVGSAVVTTPVLPGQLKGSAYLVSHGGEAFPDLDIVLEGDGITVILTGNTKITKGVTSTTFATIPDVPVTSFVLNLPVGPHSALTANGSLCAKALMVPMTIDAQSGAQIVQKTKLGVTNCPVQIVSHKVVGHKLVLKVKTFAPGRVSLKGKNLKAPRYKKLAKAKTATFTVPLSHKGLATLARHRKLKIKVRVGFVPKAKTESVSSASVAVKFK